MKKKQEIEFQIEMMNGTKVSLKEALSPVAINEDEFPAWANEMLAEGCMCVVYTAQPTLYRRGGLLSLNPKSKCTSAQLVVLHTAWMVLNAFNDTFPNATEQETHDWMRSHTLNSIGMVACKEGLKVYTRIAEN